MQEMINELTERVYRMEQQAKVANGVWRTHIEKLESRLEQMDIDITNIANDLKVVKDIAESDLPDDICHEYPNRTVDKRYGPCGP